MKWKTLLASGAFLVALLSPAALAQSSPNGSACSANDSPTAGCNGVGQMPFLANGSNAGIQTTTIDPLPTNISTVSIKSYLYAGATTRTMVEYQPWFCNTSTPCNGHKVNGMQESNSAQVLEQAQWMKSIGADVTDVDYYGCGASCGEGSGQAYNLSVTTALANAIAANPSTTPKFMIMIDGGAIDSSGGGTGQCPPASGDQSSCLESAINTQVDYLAKTWLFQSYYETNSKNGHPIVLFFINQGSWPNTNFNTVYAAVQSHATIGNPCGSGCTYSATVDFVDENAGAFSESGIAGGFAWPQPNGYSLSNQFCWEGAPCAFNYLSNFYSTARSNPSKIAMGVLYKGFDDANAGWGSNRVIAQQCGQVLGFTGTAISTAGYSLSSQLQYLQVATWNDYEEGTEVETGINNCISIGSPSISSGALSWSLVKSDATYATTNTISSFSIYTGTSSPSTLYASGISPTATSHAAPAPSPGQNVWVFMVGQPLIQNALSSAVSNSSPVAASTPTASPGAGTYAGTQSVTLSTSSPGAIICYTTNGATPATNGTSGCGTGALYSSAISVSSSETIEAVAGGSGYTDSGVGSFAYVIDTVAVAPTFNPVAGTYSSTQSVTLSTSSSGAIICYTTTGATPATNGSTGCTTGTLYSTATSVASTETINAIAGGTGYSDSSVASALYTINPPASGPSISPAAGTYTSVQSVTLSTSSSGAIICYSTNGIAPVTNGSNGCVKGALYSGAFSVSVSSTVQAVAGGTGYADSSVSSAAYVINLPTFTWGSGSGIPNGFTISFSSSPASCLPPFYPCNYTGTAVVQTPAAPFSSSTQTNSTSRQAVLSNVLISQITEATTGNDPCNPNNDWNATPSGGDNDVVFNTNSTLYIPSCSGGERFVIGVNPTTLQVFPTPPTPFANNCGSGGTAFSRVGANLLYCVPDHGYNVPGGGVANGTTIYTLTIPYASGTNLCGKGIGNCPDPTQTATWAALYDFRNCPQAVNANPTWYSTLGIGLNDSSIGLSLSWTGGQGTGHLFFQYILGVGCQTFDTQGNGTNPVWYSTTGVPTTISSVIATWFIHDSYITNDWASIARTGCVGSSCGAGDGDPMWQMGTSTAVMVGNYTAGTGHSTLSPSYYYGNPNPTVYSLLLSNPATETLIATTNCTPTCQDSHYSGDIKTDANPLIGTTAGTNSTTWIAPYKNELLGWTTNGSQTIIRFAPTYSSGTASGVGFQAANAIAAVSQDRCVAAVSSDMLKNLGLDGNGNNRWDIFLYGLCGQ
jgi:hypothetical protein